MADNLGLTIDMLLERFPAWLNFAAEARDEDVRSFAQEFVGKPKAIPLLEVVEKKIKHLQGIDDASNDATDDVEEGEPTVPNEFLESEMSDTYKEARPHMSDAERLVRFTLLGYDQDSANGAATSSRSKQRKAEPRSSAQSNNGGATSSRSKEGKAESRSPAHSNMGAATSSKSKGGKAEPHSSGLVKLIEEYAQSEGLKVSDLLSDFSPSFQKSRTQSQTSPPLSDALAPKASTQTQQKPMTSSGDEELAQIKGKGRPADTELLQQPNASQGTATDNISTKQSEKRIDVAKANEPGTIAHPLIESEAHKEGATKELPFRKGDDSTRQAEPKSIEGAGGAPIITVEGPSGYMTSKLVLGVPSDQRPVITCRKPNAGLSAEEWVKLPKEFRHCDQQVLGKFWDWSYNPVVRKKVLDYKQTLAVEADKVLDWPNKLLIALVDIQEAEIQKGAKHVVKATEVKSSEHALSTSDVPEQSAETPGTHILLAALFEVENTYSDPSYDTTTARQRLALSKDFYKEIRILDSSSKMTTPPSDNKEMKLANLAALELKAFGKGKSEESELAMEDATSGKANGKEGDVIVESSAIGEGKGKQNKARKRKGKKSKRSTNDAANGEDESKERDMHVEGSIIGKGELKENELPVKDAPTGKGKAKESDEHVKDSAITIGKEKASEPPVKLSVIEKGKAKENNLPVADCIVIECNDQEYDQEDQVVEKEVSEAKALFLDPTSNGFHKVLYTKLSAYRHDPNLPRDIHQWPLDTSLEAALLAYKKTFDIMEGFIRPQKASGRQVDLVSTLLAAPDFFAALAPLIDELKWNRAIVEHPTNPMITKILRGTQNIRPEDGIHHPSGISVAPVLTPRYPPLPPGPAPATPAITTPAKKQAKKERPGITKLRHPPIKVKLPFEDPMQVLDLREATLVAKMKDGVDEDAAKVFADLMAVAQSRNHLKEKARLELAGGKIADRMAQRQKMMAEMDGAPTDQLP